MCVGEAGIAATFFARRLFDKHDIGALFVRAMGGGEASNAPANDDDIKLKALAGARRTKISRHGGSIRKRAAGGRSPHGLRASRVRNTTYSCLERLMAVVDVTSPMSGSIFELLVSTGDAVTEGQEVLVLDSMKMEIPVESPTAGTVSEMLVAEGDAIDEGALLLKIDAG